MTDNAANNPIWPGYPFELEFEIDVSYTPAGSALRITFSPEAATPGTAIAATLTSPAAGRWRLELTAIQTTPLRAPGTVWGDFILRLADNSERPLNLRLGIPVAKPLTPPLAP